MEHISANINYIYDINYVFEIQKQGKKTRPNCPITDHFTNYTTNIHIPIKNI